DLRLVRAAVPRNFTDYKALVCLFLFGGNDANNLVIPTSTDEYNAYSTARQGLALAANSLLGITQAPGTRDRRTYGLHPSCAGLQSLLNAGKLAVVAHVGTLVAPVTRSTYLNKSGAPPPPPRRPSAPPSPTPPSAAS